MSKSTPVCNCPSEAQIKAKEKQAEVFRDTAEKFDEQAVSCAAKYKEMADEFRGKASEVDAKVAEMKACECPET